MIHRHLPSDQCIVDLVFSISAMPKTKKAAWLLAMIATYGKTPKQLKGFTWNTTQNRFLQLFTHRLMGEFENNPRPCFKFMWTFDKMNYG